jgi:hypothetical protein
MPVGEPNHVNVSDLHKVFEEVEDALSQLLFLEKTLPANKNVKRAAEDLERAEQLLLQGGIH